MLPIHSCVLFAPGVVTLTGFEATGLPLPKRPIWLLGEGLQFGGWQIAVMEAAPGNVGVTVPVEAAGIVVGVVERKSSARPVSVLPLISSAVAESGCVLFWLTVTLVRPPVLGTFSVMETGGSARAGISTRD